MKFNDYQYERPNIEDIKTAYRQQISVIEQDESLKKVKDAVNETLAIQRKISTLATLVSIRHSIDTKDSYYEAEQEFWDENNPIISEWDTDFYRTVLESKFLKDMEDLLPETLVKMAENKLKTFSVEIIPMLQKENKLVTEYDKLIASAEIKYKGQTYNLQGMIPLSQSPERSVRKDAQKLVGQFFASNQNAFDRIYDDLVQVRNEMARSLGFKDFTEMGYARMNRLDYNRQDVEVYRSEVLNHVVPVAQAYYDRQKERIGVESFKAYDVPLEFSDGNATPIGTSEEIIAAAVKMYNELSPETSTFMNFMVEHDLLDLVTKPGKRAGGYCTYIPDYESPFIFSNFNGTSGDVDVLTHEAGHAFQVFQSRWIDSPEIIFPTYESCEIHSMSMEFFAWPWMNLFFGDQTDKYKYSHLGGAITFLPYGVLVDHFQHEVYEHPEMTPAQRRAKWRELEKQYTPWKDYDGDIFFEEGGFWFKQGHIFSTPFYYIDYTLAQMCALQFWQRNHVHKDKDAWQDYLKLCNVGGTKSFLQLVELGHLKSPFQAGNLKAIAEDVDAYLKEASDKL